MAADSLAMESQNRAVKAMLEATQHQCALREAEIKALQATVAQHENTIRQAEEKARTDEIVRFDLIFIFASNDGIF